MGSTRFGTGKVLIYRLKPSNIIVRVRYHMNSDVPVLGGPVHLFLQFVLLQALAVRVELINLVNPLLFLRPVSILVEMSLFQKEVLIGNQRLPSFLLIELFLCDWLDCPVPVGTQVVVGRRV